jgi:hypothetical protein
MPAPLLAGPVTGPSVGAGVSNFLQNVFGGAYLHQAMGRGKRKRRHAKAQQNFYDFMASRAPVEGWSPELLESLMRGGTLNQQGASRMFNQYMEFFSRPGAAQALEQTRGMFGREAPDVYGPDWASAQRRGIMGGAAAQMSSAREGLARQLATRGTYGAGNQAAMGQIAGASTEAQANALTRLQTLLADKRYGLFEQQFGRDFQSASLLNALVMGQQAAPYVVPKQGLSGTEKLLAAGNIFAGGAKGAAAMFGAG